MLFCSEVDLVPSLIGEKDALLRFGIYSGISTAHAPEQRAEELDHRFALDTFGLVERYGSR